MEIKRKKSQRSELENNLRYFSVYKKLPIIVAAILLGLFFIWGIVDACAFNTGYSSHSESYRYHGVMGLPSGFLCWFIWMLIGAVVAVCTYFSMKIAYSHKLLQIYYLQVLTNQTDPILNNTKTDLAVPDKNDIAQNVDSETKTDG